MNGLYVLDIISRIKKKMVAADWFVREIWRQENGIKGKCYYLMNSRIPQETESFDFIPGVLRPSGICLYTNKKFFIQEDPNPWTILYITDNEERFNELTRGHWAGEKGLLRNLNCWDVLKELAYEGGNHYQLDVSPLAALVRVDK